MWNFGRKLTARQWAEVEERLGQLEREMKRLTLEWTDAYDRLKHMMGRVAKRSALLEKAEESTVVEHGVEIPAPGLTPRLQTIQSRILRRRGMGKTNGGE